VLEIGPARVGDGTMIGWGLADVELWRAAVGKRYLTPPPTMNPVMARIRSTAAQAPTSVQMILLVMASWSNGKFAKR
jgi:hypothetical protein